MTEPTSIQRSWWRERPLVRVSALLAGAVLLSSASGWTRRARTVELPAPSAAASELSAQLLRERIQTIGGFADQYDIPMELAEAIYDIALSEGITPWLAFRLVKVESNFKSGARSPRDAIGYTQVQVATARFYQAGITEEQLYDRDTNLRIGFRFLKDLMRQFDYNVEYALLAYNRGPARVQGILAAGGDPRNGYSDAIMKARPKAGAS